MAGRARLTGQNSSDVAHEKVPTFQDPVRHHNKFVDNTQSVGPEE